MLASAPSYPALHGGCFKNTGRSLRSSKASTPLHASWFASTMTALPRQPVTDEDQVPAMIEALREAGFTGSRADAALVLHSVLREMPRECASCSKNRVS